MCVGMECPSKVSESDTLCYTCDQHLITGITKLPTSRKVLSTFRTYCTDGGQVAQMVVHFANFQVQAWKRGVLGWVTLGLGCFMYVHILERGV